MSRPIRAHEAPEPADSLSEAMSADERALWSDYLRHRDASLRERIVLHYAPLVKYAAGRVAAGVPAQVDHADLISAGMRGLLEAVDRFDPGRGWAFSTYALTRIRGAIVDELRAMDWVPRSVRARMRTLTEAQAALHARLGRYPSDEELAEHTGMSATEIARVWADGAAGQVLALDDLLAGDEESGGSEVADVTVVDPLDALHQEQTRMRVEAAMTGLPERDRLVLTLYYLEGLTLTQIAEVLGVTQARVSQLHARALARLRDHLESVTA